MRPSPPARWSSEDGGAAAWASSPPSSSSSVNPPSPSLQGCTSRCGSAGRERGVCWWGEMGSWPPQDWRGAPHSTYTPRGSCMLCTHRRHGGVGEGPAGAGATLPFGGGGQDPPPPPRCSEPFPGPTRFNRVNFVICCPYPLHGQATTATPPYPQPGPRGGLFPFLGGGTRLGQTPWFTGLQRLLLQHYGPGALSPALSPTPSTAGPPLTCSSCGGGAVLSAET